MIDAYPTAAMPAQRPSGWAPSIRAIGATALFLACILSPLTNLKVADIEPVEVFEFFWILSVVFWLAGRGGRFPLARELTALAGHYGIFALLAFITGLLAFRLDFYPPAQAVGHVFKRPEVLFVARLVEFGLAASSMIVFANILRNQPALMRFAAASYVWIGFVNALYAIISWCVLFFQVPGVSGAYDGMFGAYYRDPTLIWSVLPRARAFFVEGGPYGIYAVSVVLVALFRRRALRDASRLETWIVLLVMGTSIVLSMSKAAVFCLGGIWLWLSLRKVRLRQFLLAGAVVAAIALVTPISDQLEGYWWDYQNLEAVAASDPDNGNIVVGRIAAMYIVPRIVVDHPLIGVGFGNYPLVRNNPRYLGIIPQSDYWDIPGTGLLGYAADLGIPLLLYVLWIVWRPVQIGLRLQAPAIAVALAGYQFFSEVFGAQITFFYPWLVTALALGFILESSDGSHASPLAID